MNGFELFWLAPILPLSVFGLLTLGLARSGRLATGLAITAMGGATVVSGLSLYAVVLGRRAIVSLPWLTVGGRPLTLALWLDPLSASIAMLVAIVGFIVFLYAASYMAQDPRRGRFFAELSLFAGSMLTLVLAANLITLFIGWELVGVCSYLLIGFWFEREAPPRAATQALLTTRLADLLLLAGILFLIGTTGSGRIDTILAALHEKHIAANQLLFIALLLFAGAAGKSAQFPFQRWLPDAMAGPTPVSALLHSATMVAAGVFLVARLYPLFLAASPSLAVVAWIGLLTSLLGGSVALVEMDLKRTLAYSTMSQIGLMFVGLGSGSLLAGLLLLIAQAFYKATLFLAAGAVDQAVEEQTTFEYMGGLWRQMPLTALAFALAAAALAGLPVALALPAKDPVLAAAWQSNLFLFVASLLASLLTALYSTRAFSLVFLGPPSPTAQRANETELGLLIPILVLAALLPLVLMIDTPLLASLLGGQVPDVPTATLLTLSITIIGVILGLGGRTLWPLAFVWPGLRRFQPLLQAEFGFKALYRLIAHAGQEGARRLENIDHALFDTFNTGIITGLLALTRACAGIDRKVFDAFARVMTRAIMTLVQASGRFDLQGLDAAANTLGQRILTLSQRVRRIQTGRIENYLLLVFCWGVGVLVLAVLATVIR
ncbi:hypothetical protein KSF_112130 [Reticulibacter mediterranei]|uniref:NADH-quinone oxidoreductase subunit L n=1 Tax=Reticulibacter mediterranei TaxID=2778369 RepID=A0A8J3IZ49_9CHLR|nr:NADH-quinone oxidoreductase subunit L [Reticulibacter mediterranei]GHP01166.1 hypothetical protein KSF_112130 [Reticulibacter mediterranei]